MVEPLNEVTHVTRVINSVARDVVQVTAGGHVIEATELDMADQWDFMEMAGSQLDNAAWVNTALLAASVISIDGVPQPSGVKTRDGIRQILRKIGGTGLDALHAVFSTVIKDDNPGHATDEAQTVGN